MASKIKKEFFIATKKYLDNYKQLHTNIESLKIQIKYLREYHLGDFMQGLSYDRIPISKTNSIRNQVEIKLIDLEEKIIEKQIELYEMEALERTIDSAINNLKPIHKQIIKYRYIEGLEWNLVVDKVYLEERQLRERANQAISSISIALFGKKALIEQEPLFNMLDL
ncbi:hypothetical protein [Clostridioides sp. ZZV15-6598]|uniref:hypothetical protein n=1 Tax=Clostridioides sp. ZZV15-6598 TaxID=2811501 RepID=UPI001D114B3F|nr:hypothetical protein [Clostridioides sp. ZZV15-6598]